MTPSAAPCRFDPPPRISAVIVTFERLDALKETLRAVCAEPLERILVVDNASRDRTADWLATQTDPRIQVMTLAENTGGSGGFEAGLAHFRANDPPDWCVLMDDDARPLPGAIEAFRARIGTLRALSDQPLGAVAAAVYNPDGTVCEMNRPSRNPFGQVSVFLRTILCSGREGFHLKPGDYAFDAPQLVDVGSFVGFFLGRAALQEIGPPRGDLFIYGDDVVYSLTLRQAGFSIAFAPAVRFAHACGSLSEGGITRPLWKVYYLCRNGVLIARTAAGPLLFPLALAWYLLAWSRKARLYAADERALYRRLLWRGVRDGLRGAMGRRADLPPRRPS